MIKRQKLKLLVNECEFMYLRQALSDPSLVQWCHLHHLTKPSDESH